MAWVVGGGLTMAGMTLALSAEMADFPGGPAGLAASVTPAAEAMRLLRWPAERLDTLGGYITYHNVMLFNLLLAVYGVLQGTRDVRGGEERGSLEEILAAGHSRAAVIRDRALGFAVVAVSVGVGLGLGTAVGLAAAGQPDLDGSMITMGTSGLVTLVGYALGMLLSQFAGTARAAGGMGAALICALYLATNVEDLLGPVSFIRFTSPFWHANQSRALVPGHGLDIAATGALLGLAAGMLGLAVWAFALRDYEAALIPRRARIHRGAGGGASGRTPSHMLGSVAGATLRRGWLGSVVWVAGVAGFTALFVALQPAVLDVWGDLDFIGAMTGATGAASAADAYWSFVGGIVTPALAAYVITQASGWCADLAQGRVEMMLATPVSWSMLVRGRLVAAIVAAAAILGGASAALAVGGSAIGWPPDAAGLARLLVVGLLFAAALAGLAAVVVAVARRQVAVTLLAMIVAASYLLSYLVPLFGWPEWLNRLSIFWAFANPYLAWPSATQLFVLASLAIGGSLAACAIAERTPKVA